MKTAVTMMLLPAVLAISTASAAPTWHTSTINAVYPQANGEVVIVFNEDAPTCTNASRPKYHYVRVGENGMTQEGVKMIMSAALSAAALGKPVTINFDNASTGCFVNRLWVSFD